MLFLLQRIFNSTHTLTSVFPPTNKSERLQLFQVGLLITLGECDGIHYQKMPPLKLKDKRRGRHAKRLGRLFSQLGGQNKEGGLNEVHSWSW